MKTKRTVTRKCEFSHFFHLIKCSPQSQKSFLHHGASLDGHADIPEEEDNEVSVLAANAMILAFGVILICMMCFRKHNSNSDKKEDIKS